MPQVYAFVFAAENLAAWAAGLGSSIRREGGDWRIDTPQGPATLRFAEANALGVLDHHVRFDSGLEVYVPMRVIPNGTGSEVLFTVFRGDSMTDAQFASDVAAVERDLSKLKDVLERG